MSALTGDLHGTVAVIDNYDSFAYNLVQYLGELGARVHTLRNDAATAAELAEAEPAAVVISPGPCTPDEAGISLEVVRLMGAEVPILGVCLGHQAIGQAYGGRVVRAPQVMHGKVSRIRHRGGGCCRGLPDPFEATRYHSLIVDRETLPADLEVTAWSEDGLIMGLRHRRHRVEGVQFHPESICTPVGRDLLRNFLDSARVPRAMPVGAPA
ncbi:MAG: aminodeoxychorismate/anthranilate synthase component II [Chloroflexi bacterium]|nr:MAG: aminodeoxychorismate/anthranilate synthase component II [Chloroflexota bacterium]